MTGSGELASLPLRDRIAAVFERSGLNQAQFAAAVGTSQETASRWINGWTRPDRQSRKKLAAFASQVYEEEISPDTFADRPVDRPPPAEEALNQLVEIGRLLHEELAAIRDDLRDLRARLEPPEDPPTVEANSH